MQEYFSCGLCADYSGVVIAFPQVRPCFADGLACRPGSVPGGAGGRPSIYGCRCRHPPAIYPRTRAGRPRTCARPVQARDFLILLQVGFAEPAGSPRSLVVSYSTVSPLPAPESRRSVLCGTFPRVTPGGCYPPPCPVEPGPSSVPPEDGNAVARPAHPRLNHRAAAAPASAEAGGGGRRGLQVGGV